MRRRALAPLLIVLVASSACIGMDHDELAKVVSAIPPNGPFWKYGNVRMPFKAKEDGMAAVIFPHWSHRARYTCRVCHQDLGFSMRQGESGITMRENVAGKQCGACHNGVIAFTVKDKPQPYCDRCHMKHPEDLEEKFAAFAESLPMASFGNGIDWAAALKDGAIRPANSLQGSTAPLQFPDKLRKPLKLGTASPRSDVSFSHLDHFAELDCSSCHPDIFNIKRKGTVAFTMDSNIYGNFCGACHMMVAFPMSDCKRCHPTMSNH